MKISKSDRRTRIFTPPIRTVSSLNGQRASTIEPWIMRRERFSRRRNEPAHLINDYGSHLIGRSRSVTGVKAVIPIIVSVEATQGPPIGPIKVPEKTCKAGWSCWRAVSYTHLRAHETPEHLVCRLLLEKKKNIL